MLLKRLCEYKILTGMFRGSPTVVRSSDTCQEMILSAAGSGGFRLIGGEQHFISAVETYLIFIKNYRAKINFCYSGGRF